MKFTSDRQRRAVFANMNKFSDSRFAKQIRERNIGGYDFLLKPGKHDELVHKDIDVSPEGVEYVYADTSGYYYPEPVTVEGKEIYDLGSKKLKREEGFINKTPTLMEMVPVKEGWEKVPKYETDYYNKDIIMALEEESGRPVDELIKERLITPLTIEDLSTKLKKRLLERIDSSEVGEIREMIASGEEPEFYNDRLIVDIASVDDVYKDANDIVQDFIKDKSKTDLRYKKVRDSGDWGFEDEKIEDYDEKLHRKRVEYPEVKGDLRGGDSDNVWDDDDPRN